jgi:hypothetical protein
MSDLKLECPIGLDDSPSICSAGTCAFCQIDRKDAAIRDFNIQHESDAKVIAEKDAKIVELEAGYEIQIRKVDAAEKVIALYRTAMFIAVNCLNRMASNSKETTRHAFREAAAEIAQELKAAYEQITGTTKETD